MRCFFSVTRSVCSKIAYNGTVLGCSHRFTVFLHRVWLKCSPGAWGKVVLAFRDFSLLTTHLPHGYCLHLIRRLYAATALHYVLRNWRFQVLKNLRNDLSQRCPAIIVCRWVRDLRLSV
jgi:hypothetical protein